MYTNNGTTLKYNYHSTMSKQRDSTGILEYHRHSVITVKGTALECQRHNAISSVSVSVLYRVSASQCYIECQRHSVITVKGTALECQRHSAISSVSVTVLSAIPPRVSLRLRVNFIS